MNILKCINYIFVIKIFPIFFTWEAVWQTQFLTSNDLGHNVGTKIVLDRRFRLHSQVSSVLTWVGGAVGYEWNDRNSHVQFFIDHLMNADCVTPRRMYSTLPQNVSVHRIDDNITISCDKSGVCLEITVDPSIRIVIGSQKLLVKSKLSITLVRDNGWPHVVTVGSAPDRSICHSVNRAAHDASR